MSWLSTISAIETQSVVYPGWFISSKKFVPVASSWRWKRPLSLNRQSRCCLQPCRVGLQLTVPENCFVLLSDGFDSNDSDGFHAVWHLLTIDSTAGWQPPLITSFHPVYWRQFWCLLFLFYSGNSLQMKHSFLNCFNFLSLWPVCCLRSITLPDYCWFS